MVRSRTSAACGSVLGQGPSPKLLLMGLPSVCMTSDEQVEPYMLSSVTLYKSVRECWLVKRFGWIDEVSAF